MTLGRARTGCGARVRSSREGRDARAYPEGSVARHLSLEPHVVLQRVRHRARLLHLDDEIVLVRHHVSHAGHHHVLARAGGEAATPGSVTLRARLGRHRRDENEHPRGQECATGRGASAPRRTEEKGGGGSRGGRRSSHDGLAAHVLSGRCPTDRPTNDRVTVKSDRVNSPPAMDLSINPPHAWADRRRFAPRVDGMDLY